MDAAGWKKNMAGLPALKAGMHVGAGVSTLRSPETTSAGFHELGRLSFVYSRNFGAEESNDRLPGTLQAALLK